MGDPNPAPHLAARIRCRRLRIQSLCAKADGRRAAAHGSKVQFVDGRAREHDAAVGTERARRDK